MRILFDECVPIDLRGLFPDHTIITVTEQDWKGTKNGEFLKRAAVGFDLFLTIDKKSQFSAES